MMRLLSRVRNLWRREDGTATVEFVFIFPVMFGIFMSGWESGLLMTRAVLLDRSLDMVMRDLRLGNIDAPTHAILKERICARTVMINDCIDNLRVSLEPVNTTTWTFPARSQECRDRSTTIEPVVTVNSGAPDEVMLVRVCVPIDAVFPGSAVGARLPKDGSGAYRLVATSAFVNEP